jgi:serine/threonine protein kinase
VKNSQVLPTTASDVWSVGCLLYEVWIAPTYFLMAELQKVLSKKVPYYKYIQDSQIRSALSQDELPIRPVSADSSTDEIDDESWELIMRCCTLEPESRLKLADIQNLLKNLSLEDNRPVAKPLPGAEILKERYPYDAVDILRVGEILEKLKVSQRRA